MAGLLAKFNSGEISLSAGVAKTALQLVAAANHRVLVEGIGMYLKGISPTDTPVRFRIVRQSTAGTMTAGTVGTHLSKSNDSDDETLQTSVQINASAEPTLGDILGFGEIHPQTGVKWFTPLGKEQPIKGGGRLGFEFLAAQAQTVVIEGDLNE